MKIIKFEDFTDAKTTNQALQGLYGSVGKKGLYITCIKDVVIVNACGAVDIDEVLPQPAFAWNLLVFGGDNIRSVRVNDSRLNLKLNENETAFGSYHIKG
jgi:hypothetical protein